MSVRDREDAVVARLHQLAPHLDGEPDPAFRAATRARLVAMAAVRTPGPRAGRPGFKRLLAARADDAAPARWRTRLTAGLAGAALTVTARRPWSRSPRTRGPATCSTGSSAAPSRPSSRWPATPAARPCSTSPAPGSRSWRSWPTRARTHCPPPGPPRQATVLAAGADPALVIETLETMDDQTTEGAAWLAERAVSTQDDGPLDDLSGLADRADRRARRAGPRLPDAAGAAVVPLPDPARRRRHPRRRAAVGPDLPGGPAVGAGDALGPMPGGVRAGRPPGPQAKSRVPASPAPACPAAARPPRGRPRSRPRPAARSTPARAASPAVSTGPGTPTIPGGPSVPGLPTPTLPLPTITLPGAGTSGPHHRDPGRAPLRARAPGDRLLTRPTAWSTGPPG